MTCDLKIWELLTGIGSFKGTANLHGRINPEVSSLLDRILRVAKNLYI